MSKKQMKNAPLATANTPTKPAEIPDPATQEDQQAAEKIIEAKPVDRLALIEQQLAQADVNFQQIGVFIKKMGPLIQLSEQIKQQRQPQPQSEQPSAGGYGDIIKQVLGAIQGGGGGSPDSELAQLGKDALKSQIAMSAAITNAVVSRITGKAVIEVAEKLVGS